MGKNINIYLNEDSALILDEMKKKDPSFNVSAFLQEKIIKFNVKKESLNEIYLELEKKTTQINQLRIEIAILEEKKFKLEAQQSLDREEKAKEKIRNERIKVEYIKEITSNVPFFFDVSKEMAEIIAEEMADLPNPKPSILEYGKLKGLKQKWTH